MGQNRANASVFIDVTQLVHWSGRLTGIPRVVNELATRFAKDPSVRYVVWVKELKVMAEIDFTRTMSQRGQGIAYIRKRDTASTAPAVSSTLHAAPVMSIPLRRHAVRIAKAVIRKGGKFSPALAQKIEFRARIAHLRGLQEINFQPQDILIIPWGEWWDEEFTACLLRYHARGIRLVQIIHDIATTVWPQFFEQVKVNPETYNASIIPVCSLVLAVSENTKRELTAWLNQQHLHVPPIKVFRNGDDIKVANPTMPRDEQFVSSKIRSGDYILNVGTIEAKKNHALLYYVYKLAKARNIELPPLVIVGRKGWRTADIYELMTNDPEVARKFVFLHNVSDDELAWLYDNCLFTVLPSFHEGWGIPVAESLARGVPCACSNTSSLVEIAEGIVAHFSPASSDECLAAIVHWLDPQKLEEAKRRVRKYKPTSWDDTYQQVMSYIKEIA